MGSNEEKLGHELDEAVRCLSNGGVISFPTETFYGLGVNPFDEKAVEKLFSIKKRSKSKAILLLARDTAMLSQLVTEIPDPYLPLMERFWPGPLTLLFPAGRNISDLLTGGTGVIGVRISSSPVVKMLFRRWSRPITATSANISGRAPAGTAGEVSDIFGRSIDYILDGGAAPAGKCSTIVGLEDGELTLVRKGKVSFEEILR